MLFSPPVVDPVPPVPDNTWYPTWSSRFTLDDINRMLQAMDAGDRFNLIGQPVGPDTMEPVFDRTQLEQFRDSLTNSGTFKGFTMTNIS